MVPEVSSKADVLPASFTMKIGEGAKDTILKFCGGTTVEVVRHVVKFWALEGKLKYQASYAAVSRMLEEEKKELSGELDKSKKMEKDGDISKDEMHDLNDEVQKLTDRHVGTIDGLLNDKQAEIMQV